MSPSTKASMHSEWARLRLHILINYTDLIKIGFQSPNSWNFWFWFDFEIVHLLLVIFTKITDKSQILKFYSTLNQ